MQIKQDIIYFIKAEKKVFIRNLSNYEKYTKKNY
jgi:hypothetical protein